MSSLTAEEVRELRRKEYIAIVKREHELFEEAVVKFLSAEAVKKNVIENLLAFFSIKEQKKVLKRIWELWVWMFSY